MTVDIMTVRKGDIVRFKSYALRVEAEPIVLPGAIKLAGRISINGCPLVTKRFIAGMQVKIERP
jgi:hypothetical protein